MSRLKYCFDWFMKLFGWSNTPSQPQVNIPTVPPNNNPTEITMNKKALCVGINDYVGTNNDLAGCINDCNDWADILTSKFGFGSITKLKNSQATRQGIKNALQNLVGTAKAGDVLVFTYSGHGSFVVDMTSPKPDHKNETIYTFDGNLFDYELRAIFDRLPDGVSTTAILDSCLSGDTKIPLLDGTEQTIRELAKRNESFWVYSCKEDGAVVPGKAHSARITGHRELIEVVLDNGETIECTKDHKFMMRDGNYKEAGELVAGESLMPLYRKTGDTGYLKGYELVRCLNGKGRWMPTHLMVRDGTNMLVPNDGKTICHHKNFKKLDNRPENLEMTNWEDHKKMHGEIGAKNLRKTWENPEFRKWRQSSEYKDQQSDRITKKWQDEDHHRSHAASNLARYTKFGLPDKFITYKFTEENRQKILKMHQLGGVLFKAVHSQQNIDRLKALNNDPLVMAKITAKRKVLLDDPNSNLSKSLCSEKRLKTLREMATYKSLASKGIIKKEELSFKMWQASLQTANNHKVVSVKQTGKTEDVYDLTVEIYHNFAVSSGVFIHNCHAGTATRFVQPGSPKPRFMPPRDPGMAELSNLPTAKRLFISEGQMKEILYAGAKSREYSYDALIHGRPNGAFTKTAIDAINKLTNPTNKQVYDEIRRNLPSNDWPQTPQLEGSDSNKAKPIFS